MPKPFISHDGPDNTGHRAEVWVETGTGAITAVEGATDDDKRNVRVVISPEYLDRPVYAWVGKEDPLFPIAMAALESTEPVQYRVESQRRKTVDRATPIQDLRADTRVASKNINRILAGLNGTLGLEAVTNPAEDPNTSGRIPAINTTGGNSTPAPTTAVTSPGAVIDPDMLRQALNLAKKNNLSPAAVDVLSALAAIADPDIKMEDRGGPTGPQVASGSSSRPREEPPYSVTDSDQGINFGSYAVAGSSKVLEWAHQYLSAKAPHAVESPDFDEQVEHLAGLILALADVIQVRVRGGGAAQRNAHSHAVCRQLVQAAIERDGLPLGQGESTANAWAGMLCDRISAHYESAARVAQGSTGSLLASVGISFEHLAGTPEAPVDLRRKFVDLATRAGFSSNREPVGVWLRRTFSVDRLQDLSDETLQGIFSQYGGPDGADRFAQDVAAVYSMASQGANHGN